MGKIRAISRGLVVDWFWRIRPECIYPMDNRRKVGFRLSLRFMQYLLQEGLKTRHWDEAIWPANTTSKGIFHFLIELMPRLWLMEQRKISLPIILSEPIWNNPIAKGLLPLLTGLNLQRLNNNEQASIDQAWLGNFIGPISPEAYGANGPVLRAMADDLKRRLNIQDKPHRRLYISRQNSVRKLRNADEIEPLLAKAGFETVFLEKLSVTDQIAIIAEARIIFSLHGAGLSNVIFAPPGCHVIELSDSRIYDFYGPISRSVGHHYHRLEAAQLHAIGRKEFNLADMECDAAALRSLLASLPLD